MRKRFNIFVQHQTVLDMLFFSEEKWQFNLSRCQIGSHHGGGIGVFCVLLWHHRMWSHHGGGRQINFLLNFPVHKLNSINILKLSFNMQCAPRSYCSLQLWALHFCLLLRLIGLIFGRGDNFCAQIKTSSPAWSSVSAPFNFAISLFGYLWRRIKHLRHNPAHHQHLSTFGRSSPYQVYQPLEKFMVQLSRFRIKIMVRLNRFES